MREYIKLHKKTRITIGVICIVLGFLALITPLTPGSWLIFVGLEVLGFDIVYWEKFKGFVFKSRKK